MMRAMLLPKSSDVMKRDWFLKNSWMILAENEFLVSSTSSCSRLTLLNAISKPEQRAEKNRVMATTIQWFMAYSSSSTSKSALPEYMVYSEKSSRATRLSASICLSGVTILTCERV